MKEGGIQAVLVVCTARILVYNCLDAPYQPAGGLPDRHVRYPTGPAGRSFWLKILRILKILKILGGTPPPLRVCVDVQPAG